MHSEADYWGRCGRHGWRINRVSKVTRCGRHASSYSYLVKWS